MDSPIAQTLESCLYALTEQQGRLRKQHVSAESSVRTSTYRYEMTWHQRPLKRRWVPTVGGWGRVWTPDVLMELAGVGDNDLRVFKHRYALQTPRLLNPKEKAAELRRWDVLPQWDLARAAYFRWTKRGAHETPEKIAQLFGILPVELRIYVECISHILVENDTATHFETTTELEQYLAAYPSDAWLPLSQLIDAVAGSYSTRPLHEEDLQ